MAAQFRLLICLALLLSPLSRELSLAHDGHHEPGGGTPVPGPGEGGQLLIHPGARPHVSLRGPVGSFFEVEAADKADGAWSPVRRLALQGAGAAQTNSWPDELNAPRRFYRVKPLAEFEYAPNFELIDRQARAWSLAYHLRNTNLQAIVLAFVGQVNPITTAGLTELASSNPTNQVPVWVIHSDNSPSRETMMAASTSAKMDSLVVLHDRGGAVAQAYGVKAFPEFVCILPDGLILYRGRRSEADTLAGVELRDLLGAAIAAAKTASVPATLLAEPVGLKNSPPPTPDYASEIAPVLAAKCVNCHSVGNVAPWAMTNHAIVAERALSIQAEVLGGHMPPWHVDPEYGDFSNDRSLTKEEITKLVAWIKAGAPRGLATVDPLVAYTPPATDLESQLGPPDAIIELPAPELIKATGVEEYRYRHVRSPFTSNVWLRAASIRPSNTAVAHHMLVATGRHTASFVHDVAGYVPGTEERTFPEGTGRLLQANQEMTFELHYNTIGAPAEDRPRLALWLHKNPVGLKQYTVGFAANFLIRIPAYNGNYASVAERWFERDTTIYSLTPHMHLRGKSMRYDLIWPDGKRETLLNVPHYDFHWQLSYMLAEPLRVPADSVLQVRAVYDNSYMNLHNPNPGVEVRWGDQSFNEMLIGYFEFTE